VRISKNVFFWRGVRKLIYAETDRRTSDVLELVEITRIREFPGKIARCEILVA